jgi:hypothetical protein
MASGPTADPVRATFVAILQQLNRAESVHEGRLHEQAIPLQDLAYSLRDFWAVEERRVQLPQALGLLVRNGLVRAEAVPRPVRGPAPPTRYRITAEGKQFLIGALDKADRIQ